MTREETSLNYIQRTKYYYQTLGFGTPYQWATYEEVPFTPMSKPLNACTVGLVTTAALFHPEKGDQGPGAPYNAAAKFFKVYKDSTELMPDLRISHIGIDRDHTTAEDIGSYFPLKALRNLCDRGMIGSISRHFYGLPTNRSQQKTIDVDCPELLSQCQADDIDIALLLPNCPVCHQSTSLAARTLEAAGIVTVIMGCAKDIVEHVGVPRFLFNNLPLGNSAGLPNNKESQSLSLKMALELAVNAAVPRTTVQTPLVWHGRADWQNDYSNPDKLSATQIRQRRDEFNEAKTLAKSIQNNS